MTLKVIQKDSPLLDTTLIRLSGVLRDDPFINPSKSAQQNIILNVHGVHECSSVAVGHLLILKQRLVADGKRLLLVAVPKHMKRVMEMSGAERHFELFESEMEAINSLKGGKTADGN